MTDHVFFAASGESVPIVPPISARTARVWSPAPNVLIEATDKGVNVYQRDGDRFVLRGNVGLGAIVDPEGSWRDAPGWSALLGDAVDISLLGE